jgi:hypothetical protein
MSLLVIAYPELAARDLQLIEDYRKLNDKMFTVVRPHFTLVFPVSDFSSPDFLAEAGKQLEDVKCISFCLRSSVVNKDAFSDCYHSFLVPDEGFSHVVKLHDKLYSGKLAPHHRLDIDYIPHIRIGNSTAPLECKKMTDEWNARGFEISGIISSVDIVNFENETVTSVEKIKLSDQELLPL